MRGRADRTPSEAASPAPSPSERRAPRADRPPTGEVGGHGTTRVSRRPRCATDRRRPSPGGRAPRSRSARPGGRARRPVVAWPCRVAQGPTRRPGSPVGSGSPSSLLRYLLTSRFASVNCTNRARRRATPRARAARGATDFCLPTGTSRRVYQAVRSPRSLSQSTKRSCQVVALGTGFGFGLMPNPCPPLAYTCSSSGTPPCFMRA